MDLRKYLTTPEMVDQARRYLSYQPFILSDDIHTGVAYSWLYHEEGGRRAYDPAEFVFEKSKCPLDVWENAYNANLRMAKMYDDWLDFICARMPGASVADVGCNAGYFLVGSQMRGMGACTGVDAGAYGEPIEFLNDTLKTNVTFLQSSYNSWTHEVPGLDPHDIVIASAIIQHVSDPLYFLSFLGKTAKKALFLFTGMGDSDEYLIYYTEPNRFYTDKPFPVGFDNDVGVSRGLLMKSLDMLGFNKIIELPWQEDWLPRSWKTSQRALLCLRTDASNDGEKEASVTPPL